MIGTLASTAALLTLFLVAADEPGSVKAVIITGHNPGHNWKQSTRAVQDVLKSDQRFEVRVVEDPAFLESPALTGYDVIILNFSDGDGQGPGDKARKNLHTVIEAGKGLVVLHHASAAWPSSADYAQLAGRVWKEGVSGHDPKGDFRVEVLKTENPIVKGLEPYDTEDELYYSLEGDQAIEVLATAKSKITGRDEPMAFVFPLGEGRVFHITLGHNGPAIHVPGTAELLRRGTAWAAGQSSLTPPSQEQAQSAPQPAAS